MRPKMMVMFAVSANARYAIEAKPRQNAIGTPSASRPTKLARNRVNSKLI